MNILDLGCGKDKDKIYNQANYCLDFYDKIDFLENKNYISWDLNKLPLPYSDNFFDEVNMKHVLEHFPIDHGIKLIQDIHRVLKIQGRFLLEIPDILFIAKELIKVEDVLLKPEKCSYSMLEFLYGDYNNSLDIHKCGYTLKTLQDILIKYNFNILKTEQNKVDLRIIGIKI